MLSDRVRQLLATYVDGELPSRQREAATRLLEQSAEARAFVRQLEADAAALRRLPRRELGPEFSERVLSALGDPRPHGSPYRRFRQTPVYPAWVGLAIAASVLFVVGVGAGIYHFAFTGNVGIEKSKRLVSQPDQVVVAKNDRVRPDQPSQETSDEKRNTVPASPSEKQAAPSPPTLPQTGNKSNEPDAVEDRPILEFTADADIALDTAPIQRFEVFKELEQFKVALNLPLRDLDQPKVQERLRDKLKEDTAFQLDLSCPANAKGLDRIEAAFQSRGVKLVIDKAALTRWKKGLKTHYAFYSDDLTSEELTAILQALGVDDKKADPKQRFNQIIINHLTPANQKELCTLLGVDPRSLSAKPKGPLGMDPTQPISKKTEEQVADALAGKGTPRPEPGKVPSPKGPDRLALVLCYNPVRTAPTSSKEIKQFIATRPGQRPGAVQVLLVLRGN